MTISKTLNYLKEVIEWRLETSLKDNLKTQPDFKKVFSNDNSQLSRFCKEFEFNENEIIILLLALVPHISPGFINTIISNYLSTGGDFPEFGGVKGKNHRGILPTGETVLYILAGKDIEKRIEVSKVFDDNHLFARKNILHLETQGKGEPRMSGRLVLDEEYVDLFTTGKVSKPRLSSNFPAELISTGLEWTDLVLRKQTLEEIREIEIWLKYNDRLLNDWNLNKKVKPGYKVLFHGPSGTGKTMTACLLGKLTGRDVYRIDLSTVVSKYIGETEKNLSKLFNKAANKNWILFFDEADSLFGKRTNVRDAHDKYANQEVSYLLQRIESHAGLVILASNMKSNIDSSFTRRFNAIVEFEHPDAAERLKLWKNYVPDKAQLASAISVEEISRKYELTGANIVNVIQYAGLQSLQKKSKIISEEDLLKGIQKEYFKEGRMIRNV